MRWIAMLCLIAACGGEEAKKPPPTIAELRAACVDGHHQLVMVSAENGSGEFCDDPGVACVPTCAKLCGDDFDCDGNDLCRRLIPAPCDGCPADMHPEDCGCSLDDVMACGR